MSIPFLLGPVDLVVDSGFVFDSDRILKTVDLSRSGRPAKPSASRSRRFGRLQVLINSNVFSSFCVGISTEA